MEEVQSQEHCGLTHLLLSAGGTKGRYPVSGLQPSVTQNYTGLASCPPMPTKDRTTKSHPPGSDTQQGCNQFCWKPQSPAAAKDVCKRVC